MNFLQISVLLVKILLGFSLGLLLISAVILAGLIIFSVMSKEKKRAHISFTHLNEKFGEFIEGTKKHITDGESNRDKNKNTETKKKKHAGKKPYRVYVLGFKGGVFAEEVEKLRHEITAVLAVARPGVDEVMINIDSPGGTVVGYGLVAAQLDRIRQKGVKLTAMVDRVAASGGYMAAVVADKIVAAPFAYIGSIGVVQEFPNFSKLINKLGVEWKTYTAGESKRDVGQYGKITPDAEKRLNKKLASIHVLFKNHISKYRKKVDIKKIATGEVWTAQEALNLKLVDALGVSDDIIMEQIQTANVYNVHTPETRSKLDKILESITAQAMSKIKDFLFHMNTEKIM